MNLTTYDEPRAIRLVPYLRSITSEIQERTADIERLERELRALTKESGERTAATIEIESRIFLQRRELEHATNEIKRVGCALDEAHPLRVLIPGQDGEFDHGFAWTPLDESVQSP